MEKQKILIADDNPANLQSLAMILKETGTEVIRADNGNDALAASLSHTFALALLDVQMPGMDGYELAELLRSETKTSTLPIIFLSAVYSSEYYVFKGYEAGAVDFLTKPLNSKILLSKVHIFLQLDMQRRMLEESQKQLSEANDLLDSRIRERTRELEEALAKMQVEVTKRKETEKLLKIAYNNVKRSNKNLEQFAYIASHDLQEPLRTIGGFLSLLKSRFKDRLEPGEEAYIERPIEAAKRMKSLISGLLQLSRIGSKADTFSLIDCSRVVADVIESLSKIVTEAKATFSYDDLPQIHADESQIELLFQNLIVNSIKYRGSADPDIRIKARKTQDDTQHEVWEFAVQDNGMGFDMHYAERILQVFQRLHTHQEIPGTGIGLALCKKIVERHQGRIWVESERGRGSVFYFTLRA